jgi:stage III sporulation protein AB
VTAVSPREAGAVLVALAAWQGGVLLARPFREHVRELARWQSFLRRLEAEMAWEGRDLNEALTRAGRGIGGGVEPVVAHFIREAAQPALGTAELWALALEHALWLGPDDQAHLRDLGPVLGRYSRQDQVRELEAARQALAVAERVARETEGRQARTLSSLVTLAGMAVAILLV